MNTKIAKSDRGGCEGETFEEFLIHGHTARLTVRTHKGQGLVTTASVGWPRDEGTHTSVLFRAALSRYGSGDFYRTLLRDPDARCTEKTVSAQHAIAIGDWQQLKSQAAAHYPTVDSLPDEVKSQVNAEEDDLTNEANSNIPRQRG